MLQIDLSNRVDRFVGGFLVGDVRLFVSGTAAAVAAAAMTGAPAADIRSPLQMVCVDVSIAVPPTSQGVDAADAEKEGADDELILYSD